MIVRIPWKVWTYYLDEESYWGRYGMYPCLVLRLSRDNFINNKYTLILKNKKSIKTFWKTYGSTFIVEFAEILLDANKGIKSF